MPRFLTALPIAVAITAVAIAAVAIPVTVRAAPPAAAPAQSMPIAAQSSPAQFSPAQRAEIIDIIRQALRADPSILRDAVLAMQADEGARQQQASRTAIAGSRAALTAAPGDPVAGNPQGDVTVVEFYDTRCPYCRRLLPTVSALLAQDHGIRLVFKDLPILGPSSVVEARALLAADRQGGYLKLQDLLMHDSGEATLESVRASAERAGLDAARLARDMQDPAIQQRIDANLALARKLGVEGTPALVIGDAMIPGAVELAQLEHAVNTARQGG